MENKIGPNSEKFFISLSWVWPVTKTVIAGYNAVINAINENNVEIFNFKFSFVNNEKIAPATSIIIAKIK